MKKTALLSLLLACLPAFAATAFFTGQQTMVTTVTGQMAWQCEYNYLGQTIRRLFRTSCPSSIEVE